MFLPPNPIRLAGALSAILLAPLAAPPQACAAWLGVQLQSVPPPLAAHFNLADGALMVENIMRDGPADRAGLDRWDIITAIDEQPVTSELGAFTKTIQAKAPGDTVTLSFIHAGHSDTATVTLADPPDLLHEPDWKYDSQPRDIFQERIRVRGHALTKDDKGNWMLKNILDLPQPAPLPPDLQNLFEGITTRVIVSDDEDGNHVTIQQEESSGQQIEVTVKADEPILVRRTEIVAGQESTTEKTYPDMEALRQADPEVFDMLSGTQERGVIKIGPCGPGAGPSVLKLDTLAQLEDRLDHSGQALAEYLSTLSKTLQSSALNVPTGKGIAALRGPLCFGQEPSISFRVQPEGQIEVTRRGPDAALTELYNDESDLKARDPAMYERYQALRAPADPVQQP